jgi:O-acetyl-ADP-ribose deacetylase (regulator of RNase III)
MRFRIVDGDLLDQEVDAIVNAWNRNIIPWWLLIPQGVSRALKRRAGLDPFRELGQRGPIPLGGAVVTGPGRLACRAIIHVAGINLLWRASAESIRRCVRSAVALATDHGLKRLAMPVIGAGSGGFNEAAALQIITEELQRLDAEGEVTVVRYRSRPPSN